MTAQAPAALRVDALGVSYGALVALENVSWQVAGGELLGIIGPNGAGKSSCYDAVTGRIIKNDQQKTVVKDDPSIVNKVATAPRAACCAARS